jgi:hypothetical protein
MHEVWVFWAPRARAPSGLFASREQAEAWIASRRLRGQLTKMPIGIGIYDWAIREGHFVPSSPFHASPEFVAHFQTPALEGLRYEAGARVDQDRDGQDRDGHDRDGDDELADSPPDSSVQSVTGCPSGATVPR